MGCVFCSSSNGIEPVQSHLIHIFLSRKDLSSLPQILKSELQYNILTMYMQQLIALCISAAAVSASPIAEPAVTPAARIQHKNDIPMYRRQAPSSLCVNIPGVQGCIAPDGKGSGNLPAVTSAISTATSAASAVSSAASAVASNPAKAIPNLASSAASGFGSALSAGATGVASAASSAATNAASGLSSLANGQLPKPTGGMPSSSMGGMSGMGGMAGLPSVPKAGTPPPLVSKPAGGMAGMAGMPGMNMPGMATPNTREPIPVATGKAAGTPFRA